VTPYYQKFCIHYEELHGEVFHWTQVKCYVLKGKKLFSEKSDNYGIIENNGQIRWVGGQRSVFDGDMCKITTDYEFKAEV